MNPASDRPSRRGPALAAAVPLLLAALWALLMRPEALSLLAGLGGPWAGQLYGHADCTMATVAPGPSAGVSALAALALLVAWRAPGRASTGLALVASLAWSLTALASVANTLA
jgi:hypothetical protein